jgi:hypothetical protein
MNDENPNASFSHLIRGGLAILLTISLPVVLLTGPSENPDLVETYVAALAAVVAFYFGASSSPG